METMIDHQIELGRAEIALRMEWFKLIYEQETNDADEAFLRMLTLQKGE